MITTSIIILLPVVGYIIGYHKATKDHDKALLCRRIKRGWSKQ